MAKARILIIEDNADISAILATHLTRNGYDCVQAFTASESFDALKAPEGLRPDLVISDFELDDLDADTLVDFAREHGLRMPIVVISAQASVIDPAQTPFESATEGFSEPFSLSALSAHVEEQLKKLGRYEGAQSEVNPKDAYLYYGSWVLNSSARSMTAVGTPIELTRIEFNIVKTLMEHPKQVFSKAELFEAAWGEPCTADDNTVAVHISNLRNKLKSTGTDSYIKTVWGLGFKLEIG